MITELASIGTFVWRSFMNKEKQATKEEICKRMMEARVKSPTGRELYRKRKYVVEPVFGNIKQNMGFRRFSQKGKDNCEGEFFLFVLVHNIKKIVKNGKIETIKQVCNGIMDSSSRKYISTFLFTLKALSTC